jgi:hypothetical protein
VREQRLAVQRRQVEGTLPVTSCRKPSAGSVSWVLISTLIAAGGALALSGCGRNAGLGAGADDALVVLTDAGSKVMYAPKRRPYFFTHGFVICRKGGVHGERPILRSISFNVKLKPLKVVPTIRRIPPAAGRTTGAREDWAPIGGLLGRPGDFDNWTVRGDYSSKFDGTKVTTRCDDSSDPNGALMELEIVMKVPPAGSDIDGFTISYEIRGVAHRLLVPWRMVGCGPKVDRELCTPP